VTRLPQEDPAALSGLSDEALKGLFSELHGRPAPRFIRRRILLLAVGFALQEAEAGGANPVLADRLAKLDAQFAANGEVKVPKAPVAKAGTRLLRQWQGVTHTVTVTAAGFTYKNAHYRSLSAIARKITGTQWSGPKFFGIQSERS
jgi:hypothetical protein